jgi:hypothetical protein
MAAMTMAKAEKMIANARAWSVEEGLSDIKIARRLHAFNKDLGYTAGGFSVYIMTCSTNKDWEIFGIVAGVLGLLWAWYLLHLSHSYSQIREFFDAAGPQSLKELKSSSSASSGTPSISFDL